MQLQGVLLPDFWKFTYLYISFFTIKFFNISGDFHKINACKF